MDMKKILMALIRSKKKIIAISIILAILIPMILAAAVYFITIDDGTYKEDDWSSTPFAASTYSSNVTIGDDGITPSTTAEELWDDMIQKGSNVNKYLDSYEELEKLMNAEIITQYPKIGCEGLDGIIEFERQSQNDEINLTYKSEEEFNKLVDENNQDALKYFTLDSNGNAVIATWSEKIVDNQSTYKIDKTFINYKEMVSKYTMPFDYLWAWLVVTENKEFVLSLADLVIEKSEIVIGIYDTTSTTTTTTTNKYKIRTRTDTYVEVEADEDYKVEGYPKQRSWNNSESNPYGADYEIGEEIEEKTITTTISNNIKIDIRKANTWIIDYNNEYSHTSQPSTNTTTNKANLEDTEYITKEGVTNPVSLSGEDLKNNKHAQDLKTEAENFIKSNLPSSTTNGYGYGYRYGYGSASTDIKVSVSIKKVECSYYTQKIERSSETETTVTNEKLTDSSPTTKEKTDKYANEDNFVKLLYNNKNAKNKLHGIETWLFEILEKNSTTSNMVDLTKYLLNKLTGKDFGITEYKFSEFDASSFNNIVTGSDGNLSLKTSIFTKEVFIQALQAYYDKTQNMDFYTNFLSKADTLYDTSVENNVNPELVVITARTEGNFAEEGGSYNYWGVNVPNGSKSGNSYGSFEEGIAGYANYINKYETGYYASKITQRYEERKAAGCDPLGYGLPGTLSGMQSIYSFLGKHEEGNAGSGGYYYMDPARNENKVTKIYATHEEFLTKCKNSGLPEHAEGTDTTVWEQRSIYSMAS